MCHPVLWLIFSVPGSQFPDRGEGGQAVIGGDTGVVGVVAVGGVLGGRRLVVVARIVGGNAVSKGDSRNLGINIQFNVTVRQIS